MNALPAVAIVSVTYNRSDALLVLLSQLRRLDYPTERMRIFLVDNASADNTVARVREEFPEVGLTVSAENLGTSAGFNLGMVTALDDPSAFDYIWLLDSDAEVEPGTLLPLVNAMQSDRQIGIVGSAIYDPSERGRLVTAGLRVDWNIGAVGLNKTAADGSELVDAELIPACSLLVRTSLCWDIGLWDERFWVYWGDTDWCVRTLRHGYRVCAHLGSRAWHRDWANTARSFQAPSVIYDELRGALLFNVRHAPGGSLRGTRRLILTSYAKAALEFLTTRPYFGDAVGAAVDDFLKGRFESRRYDPGYQNAQPVALEALCKRLATEIPPRPTVLIAEIDDPHLVSRIKEAFAEQWPGIRFREFPPRHRARRHDFTADVRGFLLFDLPRLFACLSRPRPDVVVADIAVPHLYTLAAGRRSVLLDPGGRAVVRTNKLGLGFRGAAAALFRGVVVAYRDLPGALSANPALREAVASGGALPGTRRAAEVRAP